jgi:hypothetical protein
VSKAPLHVAASGLVAIGVCGAVDERPLARSAVHIGRPAGGAVRFDGSVAAEAL